MKSTALRHFNTLAAAAALALAAGAAEPTPDIRFDTVGYTPDSAKCASIAGNGSAFSVVRASDGSVAYSGKLSKPVLNRDTDEQLRLADFSKLTAPGDYRLEVPGVGESAAVHIGADVYRFPFYTVTRAMYLWRCGTSVKGTHQGATFEQAACHLDDAWTDYVNGRHEKIDTTGGWHDAGDYNKYVVNAGVTVGSMLRAWEDFGPRIAKVGLDLPESGGRIPDFLAEVKWETDWVLKMQAPDGSVYHKVSTLNFCGFVMPADEKAPRYVVPWSSEATADFVAMIAQMARVIRPYDAAYADRCLAAARRSYAFLQSHPAEHRSDQEAFHTGGYASTDGDDRLWAAAELWETTGDPAALADLETRIRGFKAAVDVRWDWAEVKELGLFTYAASAREGRDPALLKEVRSNIVAAADSIVAAAEANAYARPLGSIYYWGSNGCVARQALNLEAADRVHPNPKYKAVVLDALHHLFGRNVHGRSYVTGLGFLPPQHPHDRRPASHPGSPAWPGYLVGGPNPTARDWFDDERNYRTNEIAINWNGALIYALAAVLPE